MSAQTHAILRINELFAQGYLLTYCIPATSYLMSAAMVQEIADDGVANRVVLYYVPADDFCVVSEAHGTEQHQEVLHRAMKQFGTWTQLLDKARKIYDAAKVRYGNCE